MSAPRALFPPIDFKTRFPALDGIRALAVTMVFLLHFGGGSHGGLVVRTFDAIRMRLGAGVEIFFVLSGFLITGILYDTRQDSHFFKRFFLRRSVRIFPIVYLLFAVLALMTPFVHYLWRWKQMTFLLYLGNFFANQDFSLYELPSSRFPAASATLGHLWSLCVEEQFYIVWPAIVWLLRDRVKLIWTAAALSLGTLALRVYVVHAWTPDLAERWIRRALPFQLDMLLIGALLALLLRSPAADAIQRACKWFFLGGLAAALAVYFLSPSYTSAWQLSIGLTFNAIAAAGLIGMTLRAGSPAFRLFNLRPARILGKYSYGFYVWHVVWFSFWIQVLIFIGARTHSLVFAGLLYIPLAFVTNFLLAKLSYDLFEVRFLKFKRHFEYDSELATRRTAFAPDGN